MGTTTSFISHKYQLTCRVPSIMVGRRDFCLYGRWDGRTRSPHHSVASANIIRAIIKDVKILLKLNLMMYPSRSRPRGHGTVGPFHYDSVLELVICTTINSREDRRGSFISSFSWSIFFFLAVHHSSVSAAWVTMSQRTLQSMTRAPTREISTLLPAAPRPAGFYRGVPTNPSSRLTLKTRAFRLYVTC